MGLIRSLARRVVNKVSGREEAAPSSTAPAPPRPQRPPASAAPIPKAAPPPAAAPRSTTTTGTVDSPVADGEALATLEAGAQEVKERIDAGEPVVLLDVREPHETAGGIIPGAKIIPLGQLQARWEELKDCNEVVCYCAIGARSYAAAGFLREKGLFNATSMDGGISAWMDLGGKITPPT